MNSIMVTGGCGFIGTNFVRFLLEREDYSGRVINVDKLSYAGNPLNVSDLTGSQAERHVLLRADICDRPGMGRVMDEHEVDAICHFAAETHVDRSIVDPDPFVRSNLIGTHNLLALCREREGHIEHFHHVSTDEVFGSLGADGMFTEETQYCPNNPYSATKAGSDHLVRAYARTYGLPVTISNCSNNYGPYQFPEKLIPLMVINALEGKKLPVYGDGQHVRDWLYVRDHCAAIWEIMRHGRRGETYNVGGRNELPNIRIVESICDLVDRLAAPLDGLKSRRELISFVKDRPGHDRRYAIDTRKIEAELGWAPSETIETGLRSTVQWYLENAAWIESVRTGEYQEWVRGHYGTGGRHE